MIFKAEVAYIPKEGKMKRKMTWFVSGDDVHSATHSAIERRKSSQPYWSDRYSNIELVWIRKASDAEILEAIEGMCYNG